MRKLAIIGASGHGKVDQVAAENVVIGAGTVIVHDIKETGTYVGVPARRIEMEEKSVKNAGGVSHRIVYHKISVQLSTSGRVA